MTVVDIPAADLASATNIATVISSAMAGLGAGDTLRFNRQPGIDRYPWAGRIRPPGGLRIVGSPVEIVGETSTMIEPDGAACSVDRINIAGHSLISVAAVRVGDGIDDTTVSNVTLANDGASPATNVVVVDDADRTTVKFCHTERVKRLVWLRGDANQTLVHHNTGTDFESSAFEMGATGVCNDTALLFNKWHRHDVNADAGHMIVTTPTPDRPLHTNLQLVSNEAWGLPGVANIRDVANGASGDLVAIRGVDGFLTIQNDIRDSGEIGMTAVRGSRNGIMYEDTISNTDLSGLAIGGFAGADPTHNIQVIGLTVDGAGHDRTDSFRDRKPRTLSSVILGDSNRTRLADLDTRANTTSTYGVYATEDARRAVLDLTSCRRLYGTNGRYEAEPGAELTVI